MSTDQSGSLGPQGFALHILGIIFSLTLIGKLQTCDQGYYNMSGCIFYKSAPSA